MKIKQRNRSKILILFFIFFKPLYDSEKIIKNSNKSFLISNIIVTSVFGFYFGFDSAIKANIDNKLINQNQRRLSNPLNWPGIIADKLLKLNLFDIKSSKKVVFYEEKAKEIFNDNNNNNNLIPQKINELLDEINIDTTLLPKDKKKITSRIELLYK